MSDAGDACSEESFSASQKSFCLLYLPAKLGWGLLVHIFENCPFFFTGVAFFYLALDKGLPQRKVHMFLLLLAYFSFGFRMVFLKCNPTSSFTVKGLLPDEELAKAIA